MVTLRWIGPYLPGQVFVPGVGEIDVQPGTTITVTAAVAQGLLSADGSWWSTVPQAPLLAGAAAALPAALA